MKKNLIIDCFKEDIVRAVQNNKVTIIQGGTGIGKSTRIPQYLAECGYRVLITQPRRLAAISLATRVSDEMNCPKVGTLVGYNTGIEKCYSSEDSKIVYLTDGLALLLQMFDKDNLNNTVLIIDEIHEWGIDVESLLAWSRKQLDDGLNFKLVLMSATLNSNELTDFFPDSCLLEVPSNTYPVTFEERKAKDVENTVLELVKERRNVLVFLPGKPEIRKMHLKLDALFRANNIIDGLNIKILELHGDLEYSEQKKVFYNYYFPKVILATNIAQTSITIPDIDAVVDTGLEKREEIHEGVSGLFLRHISQSDCIQRKGRAGRCKKGKYILCSDYEYESRYLFTTPEIYLNSLDELVLRLASINLDLTDLKFVHTPEASRIADSKKLLRLLGAFDKNNSITQLGMEMAKLPLSVRYSRMLIEAKKYGVEADMLIISLLLQIGSILRHSDFQNTSQFSAQSDLFYELEVFRSIYKDGFNISSLDSMEDIDSNHFRTILEQLSKIAYIMDINISKESKNPDALKKCILCGLPDNLFIFASSYYYRDISEPHRIIDKRSIFYGKNPPYIIAIPRNLSYFNAPADCRKVLTLLSQCTSYTLEELLDFSPELFDVTYSISNGIICRDFYYNNIPVKSEQLGSVESLKQVEPNNFREETHTFPKFKQICLCTYYRNLLISSKPI